MDHGLERVFVSFERTDIRQINKITFYYNRYSILTNDSKKSMGDSKFSYYLTITFGVLNILSLKILNKVIIQLFGL